MIRVDFPVPERFISVLHEGLAIDATADAYPNVTFRGRIAKLDTRLDPATRAVTARAEFPNPDQRLRTGMLLRVKIDQAVRNSLAAPETAVVFESGDAYVLVIAPAPPQQGAGQGGGGPPGGRPAAAGGQAAQRGQGGPRLIALRRVVQTGLTQNGFVEICAGLQPNDRIVADGTNRVRPNDPIRIAGAGPGGAASGPPGAPRPGGPGQGQPPAGTRP